MLRILGSTRKLCGGFSRRDLLRVGGLGLAGMTLPDLLRWREAEAAPGRPRSFGKAKSVILLHLYGSPSQLEWADPKPNAPVEIRGELKHVSSSLPGCGVCELLPNLGKVMDRTTVLRSMTHHMNVHGPACSEIFSGREYPFPPTTDQARPEDWPSLSAMTMQYGKSRRGLASSIVLPWYLQFPGQSKLIAGQTAGRMGKGRNAMLVDGDPSKPGFAMQGFMLPEDVSLKRLAGRQVLLDRLGTRAKRVLGDVAAVKQFHQNHQQAFTLLGSRAGEAFDLDREPRKLRERYGDSKIAQSFLLARRLVEAGVSLITVNWEDPTKIDGVNTCWDTHRGNFPKLKNLLCPMFDRCFSAFLEDLHDRGLLETTLVVAVGEFGRTPKMGQITQSNNTVKTGRDHWPHAFTALLAGGGVRGGQVYGQRNQSGGYVTDKPVTPADLTATILYHVGIDTKQQYFDEFLQIRQAACEGTPVRDLG